MKLLLVGGGGREHALAWKLTQDDPSLDIIAAPGNPGIAELGRCVASSGDPGELLELARAERVDLALVGPEAPLAAGVVDLFEEFRIPIFGPTRAAAELESSKAFSKDVMRDAGVPTARAERHAVAESAHRAADAMGEPVVIKASGLAAGKGAIVCDTLAEAHEAIDAMLVRGQFGDAGREILVEEFLRGEELSLFALCDGERAVPMLPAQDHKRLLEGDRGPNTGGMGAYAPVRIGTEALVAETMRAVVQPTLDAMNARGAPFRGLLFVGLMITADGPRVIEFNCRFGDPETEALLPLMESSLLDLIAAVANGDGLPSQPIRWRDAAAVTTVVAASGYPDTPRRGDEIGLHSPRAGVHIFHAGTAMRDGRLVSAGGRVLAMTAVADSFQEAQRSSQEAAAAVTLDGKQYRRDVGWRELERNAGAARD